eukprot:TRINITY_DN233_c0_g1_i1.p1 TRINITY_DN233_c0_g1~~TRINITY_DN233_c0_g1_i1.p1  ORF type:complete len:187 (+),score=71.65 TRINITY_DN233_c0_g1_i1:202-762(+)
MDVFKRVLSKVDEFADKPGVLSDGLNTLEAKTQVKKNYILYGAFGVIILWLAFGYGAQLLCNVIGYAYPAYCSIKALETGTKQDDTQWLMYWVVFALFSVVEFFSDFLAGWVPFYWLSKCVFMMWLMSPMNGATIIYNRLVLPYFRKHQPFIDGIVDKGKQQMNKIAEASVEAAKDIAAERQLKKD